MHLHLQPQMVLATKSWTISGCTTVSFSSQDNMGRDPPCFLEVFVGMPILHYGGIFVFE